ncbi:hypothetical protein BH160DRAFT_2999 [Burkholderia sp. H160]|nr:hypothetical protein BH160DRAFT_2999 [Burkholderia sp. H160]
MARAWHPPRARRVRKLLYGDYHKIRSLILTSLLTPE